MVGGIFKKRSRIRKDDCDKLPDTPSRYALVFEAGRPVTALLLAPMEDSPAMAPTAIEEPKILK